MYSPSLGILHPRLSTGQVGGMAMLSTASYDARKFGVRSGMPGPCNSSSLLFVAYRGSRLYRQKAVSRVDHG